MTGAVSEITNPTRLWTRGEVLDRPCPVPAEAGVYGWYFRDLQNVAASGCVEREGFHLLYVGISPRRANTDGAVPRQNLRRRIRMHCSGNASASTLRLTLGVLLGIETIRSGSGRVSFGQGEAALNCWMATNARVVFSPTADPRAVELELIQRLNLPLNLEGNLAHDFAPELSRLRRQARAMARSVVDPAG